MVTTLYECFLVSGLEFADRSYDYILCRRSNGFDSKLAGRQGYRCLVHGTMPALNVALDLVGY